MFLHRVIRQYVVDPVMMLDLCAAPGGKSTCALAALPVGSVLFCNEPVRNRAQILRENIVKFGHPDVVVTNNYARDYQRSGLMFDVVLADVPCSGEGMFRKDAGAIAGKCGPLPTSTTRNRERYLALSQTRWIADILYLHVQCL